MERVEYTFSSTEKPAYDLKLKPYNLKIFPIGCPIINGIHKGCSSL